MTDQQTEGKLNQAKGEIRKTWGDLTDDDVDQARGSVEKLVGKIQERTGEAADSIREKLGGILGSEERTSARQ